MLVRPEGEGAAANYVSPRPLFEKQKEALVKSQGLPNFAYFMEMGTGKTKVIIEEWMRLLSKNEIDAMLVVAPNGVYKNWLGELAKDLDPSVNPTIGVWVSGSTKKQRAELTRLLDDHCRPKILLVNIEALSTVEDAIQLCEHFLNAGRVMFVVDESTTIKSYSAKRTKTVVRLGQLALVRRIATGTPAPRSPLDMYTQFEFLDWNLLGFKSFYAFRARYAVMKDMDFGGRKVKIVVAYRNVDELQKKIHPHSFRVLKEDCLDLPPKVYMPLREVALTIEQQRMYDQLKKFATTELNGKFVTANAVITQIIRLHQILCGYTIDEDGKLVIVPSQRPQALCEVLEEAGGKSLIWANFRFSLSEISKRLKKEFGRESTVEFWGDTSGNDRMSAIDRFQNDDKCRFFVGNPQTGGRGITLTAAKHVVYYSNSYDLELRMQSEDRAHRAGLVHSVDYTDLCVPGTIDEKIIFALRNKIDMAASITGDNWKEWVI